MTRPPLSNNIICNYARTHAHTHTHTWAEGIEAGWERLCETGEIEIYSKVWVFDIDNLTVEFRTEKKTRGEETDSDYKQNAMN